MRAVSNKLFRLIGFVCLGVLALPLVSAQAPERKISVTQLMNECRKEIHSQDVELRRRAVHGFCLLAGEVSAFRPSEEGFGSVAYL